MKKRILFVVALVVCAVCVFSACSKGLADNKQLSELRSDILIGEDDTYSVVVVTGVRENPFNIDGISQKEKSYFTVITVTPHDFNPVAEYTISAEIGGQAFSGKLARHPFNQSFSFEIGKLASAAFEVVVTREGADAVIAVQSVKTENYIDGDKAFAIAEKRLKGKVEEAGSGYEIFVRLIENPINTGGGYYWYVAYIFANNTTLATLIDPVTMEIVAIRD